MIWRSCFRLGDCYWHCLYLRKLGGAHTFYCNEDWHPELRDILDGCDVALKPIQEHTEHPDAIDAWIGSDQVSGRSWYAKGCPNDLIAFLLEWFASLAKEAGSETVFKERADFLADYPALHQPPRIEADILIVNANPQSSQAPAYAPEEMAKLARRLFETGKTVVTTNAVATLAPKYTFSEIGCIARTAKLIIGVATGPIWPCLSVATKDIPKHIILDPIRLDYGGGSSIVHHANVASLTSALEKEDWL